MTLATALKNAIASAIATALTGGSFKIKTSGGSVLETIAGVTWSASGNVVTSSNPASSPIDASGTAATYEIYDSSNVLMASGTVGTSGAELTVDSTTFTSGVTYDQGVFTITV